MKTHREILDAALTKAGAAELIPFVSLEYSNRTYKSIGTASIHRKGQPGNSLTQDTYTITLSNYYVEADKTGEAIEKVILHEVGHVLVWHNRHKFSKPPSAHGKEWKYYARLAGHPNPTALNKEKILNDAYAAKRRKRKKVRFVYSCLCPGREYRLTQKQTYFAYSCKVCNGFLQNTKKQVVVY